MVIDLIDSITKIKKLYKNNNDFILREIPFKKTSIYLLFFESLCDSKSIYDYIVKNIYNNINKNIYNLNLKTIISSPKLININKDEIIYYMENGFTIVVYKNQVYSVETKANIDRGITISDTETNMYGPKDSFCENYQKNLGIIKRRIKTTNLKVDTIIKGKETKTIISLLYLDNLDNKNKVKDIKNKINNINENILDGNILLKKLDNKLFPKIFRTEKPYLVSDYILKNHIVLLVDNSPFVLILDTKFDTFINPISNDKFLYILRYLCFFITILTPALYISLICYNQETIPTSLLINFMNQRNNVPFPAIIECILMLIMCEILRETDLKFPSSFGSAASILGALILGEAAVQAGIVSPIMIIITSITFITNLLFTQINMVKTIRYIRTIFLLSASILGLYGIGLISILLLSIMSNIETYKGDYI